MAIVYLFTWPLGITWVLMFAQQVLLPTQTSTQAPKLFLSHESTWQSPPTLSTFKDQSNEKTFVPFTLLAVHSFLGIADPSQQTRPLPSPRP